MGLVLEYPQVLTQEFERPRLRMEPEPNLIVDHDFVIVVLLLGPSLVQDRPVLFDDLDGPAGQLRHVFEGLERDAPTLFDGHVVPDVREADDSEFFENPVGSDLRALGALLLELLDPLLDFNILQQPLALGIRGLL